MTRREIGERSFIRRAGRMIVAAILFAIVAGCAAAMSESDLAFFRLPDSTRYKEFQARDLESQYRLLIVGNQAIEPPDMYLCNLFAGHGAGILPIVRRELGNAESEESIRDITRILATMQKEGLYDVAADRDLIDLVRSRVNAMRGAWKTVARENLVSMEAVRD